MEVKLGGELSRSLGEDLGVRIWEIILQGTCLLAILTHSANV